MSSEWKTLPLEDCMSAIIDYRGKTPAKTTFGVPLVTAKIVKGGRIEKPEEFIAESDYVAWMRRGLPEKGDVVMTTEAPLGEVAQLDGQKVALAQRVITLRGKQGLLENGYLRYLLQSTSVQDELKARATGTTVLGIKQSELRKVRLALPPISVQKRIAQILGTLDDKIELNRRMSATLEAMARALFQSWFVDFDPVRRNAEGGESRPEDGLFPDSFVDSEMGGIPKGWTLNRIENLAERVAMGPFGSNITRNNFIECGVPVIRGGNLTDGFVDKDFVFVSDEKAEQLKNSIAQRGDLVFTHRGTLGQIGMIPQDSAYPRYVVSQSQMLLRLDQNQICSELVYQFFRSSGGQQALLANTSQVGVPAIARPTTSLKSIQLVVPPYDVSSEFERQTLPLRRQILLNSKQSCTLSNLRDTLLPKLLSGGCQSNQFPRCPI